MNSTHKFASASEFARLNNGVGIDTCIIFCQKQSYGGETSSIIWEGERNIELNYWLSGHNQRNSKRNWRKVDRSWSKANAFWRRRIYDEKKAILKEVRLLRMKTRSLHTDIIQFTGCYCLGQREIPHGGILCWSITIRKWAEWRRRVLFDPIES